ncbi:MAG: stage 0 sporulation family protein [Clostridia bacterium]|nr:stage 0 sporulation family protein [Clostridia bacterium]
MAEIIGVKFKNTAKTYYFSPIPKIKEYPEGAGVVVETAKGLECGTIVFGKRTVDDETVTHPLKPVVRLLTEADEERMKENAAKIPDALAFVREKVADLGLKMKLITAEYSFDGKKLCIYFSADERVDFRELVKVLAQTFKVRIELRQIGIRDETKLLGGIAPCGRTCCCAGTMNDFGKVTIKMAKNQGLHLNPAKISGLCGRLMCCLEYENEYYESVCKLVPKVGGTVKTPEGEGIVVSNDMFKMISKVKISNADGSDTYKDFSVDQLDFPRKKCDNCANAEEPVADIKDDENDPSLDDLPEEDI